MQQIPFKTASGALFLRLHRRLEKTKIEKGLRYCFISSQLVTSHSVQMKQKYPQQASIFHLKSAKLCTQLEKSHQQFNQI